MPSSINASTTAGLVNTADTSGVLNIQTAGTTAISIDASQAVSFTNSPTVTGGTANGVAYLNGSKVLTTGSALTWDGTNLTVNTGTVSATYGKLTVAGGISITPDSSSKFQIGRYSAGAPYSYIKMGSTSSGLKFTDPADSVDLAVLDSSGNFGLGVTPSAWSGTNQVFEFGKTSSSVSASLFQNGVNDTWFNSNAYFNGTNWIYKNSGTATQYHQAGGAHEFYNAASGTAGNAITFTQAMTIDADGRFSNLNTAANKQATFTASNASSPFGIDVYYSATAPNGVSNHFYYGEDTGGQRMSVRSNGGIANYSANNVNLSDRREKTNFAPAGSYLDKICAIPVQTFNYIDQNLEDDGGLTLGVVAQDVQAVAPELVMESNWASKDEEPKIRLSIYQTDLQYALMKCIQEQQSLITQLQADVAALKGATP